MYVNQLAPPKEQTRRPQGSIPVIARLVLRDGYEEWRPGHANRWTASAVLVGWHAIPGDHRTMTYAWLPVDDVARVLRRSPQT